MIITDLDYFESHTHPNFLLGGTTFVQNNLNLAEINQLSIAISYGGTAIASNSASIYQVNIGVSASGIHSRAISFSFE